MTKAKVALVLGSGGARGLAHIGVLKVLEKNNIPIHLIVGTSMGAFVGGFYAAGTGIDLMENLALSVDRKFVARMLAPSFHRSGFVNGERIRSYLQELLGDLYVDQLRIPFASVSADLTTGEEIIHDRGHLVDAIMASIAIPGVFKPIRYENRYLVDGGIVNPLPVSVAHKLGADVVIAVNSTPLPSQVGKQKRTQSINRLNKTITAMRDRLLRQTKMFDDKPIDQNVFQQEKGGLTNASLASATQPHLLQTLMQSVATVETKLQVLHLTQWHADVLISPVIEGMNLLDFYRAKEMIDAGEHAANAALAEIRTAILRKAQET